MERDYIPVIPAIPGIQTVMVDHHHIGLIGRQTLETG